jgi:hypothetical protein
MRATDAGPETEDIVGWAAARAKAQGLVVGDMRRVKEAYAGRMVIPLPEMDRNEDPAVANIIAQGLDQLADRIASTTPNLSYPPLRPGIQRSEDLAETRARANLGWWTTNRIGLKMRRRARWIVGYASSPVMLRPDAKWGIARWSLRDPLNTFPAMSDDPDELTPEDCIFKFSRSYEWLKAQYPNEMASLLQPTVGGNTQEPSGSTKFDLIEYVDAEVTVLAVLNRPGAQFTQVTGKPWLQLERLPNRAGVCTAITPGRVTLDRRKGQFDAVVGMHETQAKLQALEIIAIQRGIFPDLFIDSHPGATGQVVGGTWQDGRTGIVNVVKDGTLQTLAPTQGVASSQLIDRLERNQRVTAGIAPEMGGESQSNVRTGKRGDAILSAVVDAPVQAAQELLALSLEAENRVAVAIAKNYFGEQKRTFYVPVSYKSKPPSHVDYVPNVVFEDDNNVVSYPMAGADANGLTIAIGQRIGLGTMSKHTGMELDPMIENPELEKRRVGTEAIEAALLSSVQQQASAGAIAPHDLARINILVFGGSTVAEAVDRVHQEAQARQATLAAQPQDGQATAPEAQSGLAQPGVGAEQPTVAPPGQSSVNLSDLLNSLRRPQREGASEKGLPIG